MKCCVGTQAVLATGSGRDINRHKYTNEEAEAALQQPVVKALLDLCKFRNTHQAFMGQVSPPSLHCFAFVSHCQLLLGSGLPPWEAPVMLLKSVNFSILFYQLLLGISAFFLSVLSVVIFGKVNAPEAQTYAKLALIDWESIQKHARVLLAFLSHKTSKSYSVTP